MKTIQDIKDKLKKLIAKEESARQIGNQAEAEAFASKIQELLIQYELDIAELKSSSTETTNVGDETFDTAPITNRHESNWIVYLYNACARANFCKIILSKQNQYVVSIVGTEMNRELLHFMVAQLSVTLRFLAKDSFKNYDGPSKRNTYVRSFLKGACAGIATRLSLDRMAEQKAHEDINALVVQKDRAVLLYIENKWGRLGRHVARRPGSNDGYKEGVETGKSVPINKGVARGAGGTALLGQ